MIANFWPVGSHTPPSSQEVSFRVWAGAKEELPLISKGERSEKLSDEEVQAVSKKFEAIRAECQARMRDFQVLPIRRVRQALGKGRAYLTDHNEKAPGASHPPKWCGRRSRNGPTPSTRPLSCASRCDPLGRRSRLGRRRGSSPD